MIASGHAASSHPPEPTLTPDAAKMALSAAELAPAIRQAAATANTEEDLKMGVEQALAAVREFLGISPRYEKSYIGALAILGAGASDAVYGHVVIEYKKPGVLATKQGFKKATSELEKYLSGEAARYQREKEKALRRMVGVGLDGNTIFFMRYRSAGTSVRMPEVLPPTQQALFEPDEAGGFQVLGPYPVSEESVAVFLLYLRALRRRPLTSDALAEAYGPKGTIAQQVVPTLYEKVVAGLGSSDAHSARVETFFSEWDRIFGIVYGQDVSKAQRNASALARLYGVDASSALKPLLFAVHTYYALLMKLLAVELASLQSGSLVASLVASFPGFSSQELLAQLSDLEDGGLFARLGIHNFLEGDFFGWYTSAWDGQLEECVRAMAHTLTDYEVATGSLQPEATKDLLKELYEYLIPRELRHDLGEYYTPDWLADLVLDDLGYDGKPDERLLDPACGSGTFLVLAIRRARNFAEDSLADPRGTAESIVGNIVGFDLNPLAVIAARTNYLLALGNLVRYKSPIEIPVYLCDSVLTPRQRTRVLTLEHQRDVAVPSVVGEFWIPEDVVDGGHVAQLSGLLEECVRSGFAAQDFLGKCQSQLKLDEPDTLQTLTELYDKVMGLERDGRNGIWARIVKNAFAPVFAGKFDYVAGNPPWVRWGYLSDRYREATQQLWADYGLFSLSGLAARLGGGEKDFSMLFVYACIDSYLRDDGLLGFVITQEVLKGKGAGEGFRRFRVGQTGPHFKVLRAHDLVTVRPFEGAANKTAALIFRKGKPTEYPVDYFLWERKPRVGKVNPRLSLADVKKLTTRRKMIAKPIGDGLLGAWQTVAEEQSDALAHMRGSCDYTPRRGASTEPYGVFWLQLLDARPDGLLMIENLPELGKRAIPKTQTLIESGLVFPAIRGSDIRRWAAKPEIYALISQDPKTRKGFTESVMKDRWPRTLDYLTGFKSILLTRGSRAIRELAEATVPWTMYGVGEYTFAPFRVVWKRMATDLVAAVLSEWPTPFGERKPVGTDTTAFIPCESSEEAHYLCALLNSTPARMYIRSYSSGGRGFGAPSVVTHVALPAFDASSPACTHLSELSQKAHEAASLGPDNDLEVRVIEADVDAAAGEFWGLSAAELSHLGS